MALLKRFALASLALYASVLAIGLLSLKNPHYPTTVSTSDKDGFETYLRSLVFKGNWQNSMTNTTLLESDGGEMIMGFWRYTKKSIELITDSSNSFNNSTIPSNITSTANNTIPTNTTSTANNTNTTNTTKDKEFDLSTYTFFGVGFQFYDPKYIDDHIMRTSFNVYLNETDPDNVFLSLIHVDDGSRKNVMEVNNMRGSFTNKCEWSGSIRFNKEIFENGNIVTQKFHKLDDSVYLHLFSDKNGCNLDLQANLKVVKADENVGAIFYSLFAVTIILMNWFGGLKINQALRDNVMFTSKMSLFTLILVTLQDSLLFIFHLNYGIGILRNYSFFIIFLMIFMLFVLMDYKILLYTWRYNYFGQANMINEIALRRKLYFFQLQIYGLLILYNYFMLNFFFNPWLIMLHGLILIPQILHNIFRPATAEFNPYYSILFVGVKYLLFYVIRGIPYNVFDFHPYYIQTAIGLGFLVLSLIALYYQESYGGRALVPKIFKPKQYDYLIKMEDYKKVISLDETSTNDSFFRDDNCAICLEHLFDKSLTSNNKEKSKELVVKMHKKLLCRIKEGYLMKSPCGHAFHPFCFLQWMEIKMECPCCREALPQI